MTSSIFLRSFDLALSSLRPLDSLTEIMASSIPIDVRSATDELANAARSLVSRALECYDPKYGFSTASCQVYDTAWIAMISKDCAGTKQWLFPEAFHYLMRTQSSWHIDNSSQTVAILNTAAGLLALLKHAAQPLQIRLYSDNELANCINLASKSLQSQLATWTDMEATNHIGVELIIPALLQYLKEAHPTMHFSFPNEKLLSEMHAAKMARFRTEMLYDTPVSPASYSLEAFIGKVDFDRAAVQLRNGSMWTSPSSTAAYLMHATVWDSEAEDWLRHVLRAGEGHGDGGVPGTFPTHHFEFNWIVATLLQGGFVLSDFDRTSLDQIASIVQLGFKGDGGVIGHAPGTVDVDDTAKGLLAMKLLGREGGTTPDEMIRRFEKKDAFGTMPAERDRSISSNCHVLLALLAWNDYPQYGLQIHKTASFICDYWWSSNGRMKDKWHLCHLYPTMLLVKAFTLLLRDVDTGLASDLLGSQLSMRIAIAVFQACSRTLMDQHADGSWGDSPEQTAYAVLTLADARQLCLFADFVPALQHATDSGIAYLDACTGEGNGRCWTSKTRYFLRFVREAYVLAARRMTVAPKAAGDVGRSLALDESIRKTKPFLALLKLTETCATMPDLVIKLSLTEAALFLPLLRTRRSEVFPRDELKVSQDAYFDLLPFLWVGCSNRSKNYVPTNFVFDMLFMTLINIQVDEFIEGIATQAFEHDPPALRRLIDLATDEAWNLANAGVDKRSWDVATGTGEAISNEADLHLLRPDVYHPLVRFAKYILNHAPILVASAQDRRRLKHEFRQFLHTQTTQMSDNAKFRSQPEGSRRVFGTDLSYFDWVRTIASDHVSTPLNFAWVRCWTSGVLSKGLESFSGPSEQYLAAAVSRHLATTNRMYNDFSSISRDTAECNLNSVHFPEFNKAESTDVASQKVALRALADYEHGCVERTLECLSGEVRKANPYQPEGWTERMKLGPIRLLCDVSHLWDQLYLIRDHSSTIQSREN
ncbi:unnamed protein product [Zymoseptoria tritici ST99CH_3D1]|uniref:Ent-kaurene synthase n=1 Tax=Zymoseptoria tritici ST99CH_1E4 TaxID=1276532 RepID=A0A2H1FL84_ZYMTR|nr:unnamed protein product [Zymoseptoria tritici ST99CH_1E4]SMR44265.1 unnamed protein product [Zymoseptoria tritici ST99CH_3D1]